MTPRSSAHTTDIVLEAANFSGPSILRTELHTGIRSEASNRFEKGLDRELVAGGLSFACRLFAELCGGTVAPGTVDVVAPAPARPPVRFRPAACESLLGYALPGAEQAGILRRLGCEVDEAGRGDAGRWTVTPPSFRADLEREVDLIEEVGRIAGYGQAPETLPAHRTAGGLTGPQKVARAVRRALAGCGLDEAITYTFVAPDAVAPLALPEGDVRLAPVKISNPMSVEQSVMRTMLLPGLLGAVRDNVARLNDPPNLFELGRVYLWDDKVVPAPAHAAEPGAVLPHEPEALAVVLSGPLQSENWTGVGRVTDFYTLKGVVEAVLSALGLRGHYVPLGDAAPQFPYLHPGKAALVGTAPGVGLGVLGMLRPDVAAAYGLEDLDAVCGRAEPGPPGRAGRGGARFRGPRRLPARRPGPGRGGRRRGAGRRRGGGGAARRRQAHARRARVRRLRGRPGAAGQALAGAARCHALAGAHPGRQGHRRRARQDPQGSGARVRGRAALKARPCGGGRGRRGRTATPPTPPPPRPGVRRPSTISSEHVHERRQALRASRRRVPRGSASSRCSTSAMNRSTAMLTAFERIDS